MRTIALVGCGRISERHLKVVAMIPELKLVGVCDCLEDRALAAAKAAGVPAFGEAVEMAKVLKPDIISILTDSGLHADLGCLLAPHVPVLVVEKPMALSLGGRGSAYRDLRAARHQTFRGEAESLQPAHRCPQAGGGGRTFREDGPGHGPHPVGPDPGLLRSGRLAGYLEAGWRCAHQPGQPSHRSAAVAAGSGG